MNASQFRVALTFDAEHPDRPHHLVGAEDRLREQLGALEVRATYFVQGRWAEAFPDQARRIGDDGHLIGNHSHFHAQMQMFTEAAIRQDIKMAEDVILSIIKVDPAPWFRSPFGAGADDLRLQEALAATGYRQVLWNASGDDWDHRKTVQQVEDDMVNTAVAHGDGAILLCHTWPSYTHEGLAGAVRRLREAGATFVTIDQLDQELVPGIPGLPKR